MGTGIMGSYALWKVAGNWKDYLFQGLWPWEFFPIVSFITSWFIRQGISHLRGYVVGAIGSIHPSNVYWWPWNAGHLTQRTKCNVCSLLPSKQPKWVHALGCIPGTSLSLLCSKGPWWEYLVVVEDLEVWRPWWTSLLFIIDCLNLEICLGSWMGIMWHCFHSKAYKE